MKRERMYLLTIAVLLCVCAGLLFAAISANAATKLNKYDINEDGSTNITDVTELLNYLAFGCAHEPVTVEGREPTCAEMGCMPYSICTKCGQTLEPLVYIAKLPHTVVIDEAVRATCTESGLTEGSHCSVCGEILAAQETVPATGHIVIINAPVEPTCTETGLTAGSYCSVCGETLTAQESVPATGHTVVDDPAVAPTCTETGLTEGSHCSICGMVIRAQRIVAALGHFFGDWTVTTAPTCSEEGIKARVCEDCGATETQAVPALGHNYVNGVCTRCGTVYDSPSSALETPEEIVNAAYALAGGEALDRPYTLTGKITFVNTAYNSQYENVTVTIVVEGLEDKPIQCFRMKGEGADTVKVGDTITVTGILKNYVNISGVSTIEFDANCTLDMIETPAPSDDVKCSIELTNILLPATVTGNKDMAIIVTGATYMDVTLQWVSDNTAFASIEANVLTFKAVEEEKVVHITVTATCGETTLDQCFAVTLKVPVKGDVADTLTRETTGVTNGLTTFTSWMYASDETGVVYVGQSAGSNDSIQIRSKNSNTGMIVTTSNKKAVSVTITFNETTVNGRTIQIYGSNTAYTSPMDLYDEATQGTLLGEIVMGGEDNKLDIDDSYAFIGIRSKDGAIYLQKIEIEWIE